MTLAMRAPVPSASARASSVGFGFRSPALPGAVCGLKAGEDWPHARPEIHSWRACGLAAFWGDPAAPLRQRRPGRFTAARMLFSWMFAHKPWIADYWRKREQRRLIHGINKHAGV